MRSYLVRLALRASWRGNRADVLRAVVVSFAAGVATLIACGVVSAALMLDRVTDRATQRAFTPAAEGEEPDLWWHQIFDSAPNGEQIYVHWWRFVDPDVRLPGVPAQPPTGSWYVSPALADRMRADAALAERFPDAHEIGPDGVANADELVAYRFVGPEVDLPTALSSRVEPGREIIADPSEMEAISIVQSALILLALPVVGLLLAGVGPSAVSLDRRLAILEALGASRRLRSTLVLLQTTISALPGAVVAGAIWFVVAPRLTAVPLVGREVVVGDLGLPLTLMIAAVIGVVGLTGYVATVRERRATGGRPTERMGLPPRARRLVPLASGLGMMVVGSGVVGSQSGRLYLAGLIASSVGGVIALPVLLHRTGNALARCPGVLSLLVGRRLTWNARSAARAMLVLGGLAVLTPVAAAWIHLERERLGDQASIPEIQPVPINGGLPPSEIQELQRETDAMTLELARDQRVDPTRTSDAPTVLVGDCQALEDIVQLSKCDADGFIVSESDASVFSAYRTFDGTTVRPVEGVAQLPQGFEVEATLFLGDDWREIESILRAHVVNRDEPGPDVGYVEYPIHESVLTRWVLGGLTLAAITCAVALGLHLIAHATRLTASRIRLEALGADRRTVRLLASGESGLVIALAGFTGTAVGGLANWFFVQMNSDASLHHEIILTVGAAVVAAAGAGAAASWVSLGASDRRRAD